MDNGIEHVRIDDRLIHGQVATMWLNRLHSERIMVVDDEVVKNEFEKMALKTAAPEGIHLSILTVQGAIKNILAGKYRGQKVLLISKGPAALKSLSDADVPLPAINLGNMSFRPESRQVKKSVFLTADDLDNLRILHARGIRIFAQMVPTEKACEFAELIK